MNKYLIDIEEKAILRHSIREDDSHDYSEFEILDIIPYEED